MAEVLAEAQRFDDLQAMGNYSASPFSPEDVAARFVELGESAVPYLIEMIREEREETRWALVALEAMGPVARAASDALAQRVATHDWSARTLFLVDPERALAMGLHRNPETFPILFGHGYPHGYEMFVRIAAELLADPDPRLVALAFAGGACSIPSLKDVAAERPDLVPVQLVRTHARHPQKRIRDAAVQVLARRRDPDDAFLVLDAIEDLAGHVEWLAPLPGSERHASALSLNDLHELLRRRRCAGLSNAAIDCRPALANARRMSPYSSVPAYARVVRETMDVEAMRELPRMLEYHFAGNDDDPVLAACHAFGEAAREAIAAVRREATGRLLASLTNLEGKLATFTPPPWLARADADFIAGRIEPDRSPHGKLVDTGAYGGYALALLDDPRRVQAAFQLAWIDRRSGTPITAERIAWLRSLGMRDDALLQELSGHAPREPSSSDARARHLDRVRRT
ncbi:MAG: hypothetical protein U1E76_16600 [Planctomycetota bacterium]